MWNNQQRWKCYAEMPKKPPNVPYCSVKHLTTPEISGSEKNSDEACKKIEQKK